MEREIRLPISEEEARALRVEDILYLTGTLFTARDEAHHRMLEAHRLGEAIPFRPDEMALFHCGPVVRRAEEGWEVVAAGPTTSVRMELFEDDFLRAFGTRIVIGKGGMGERTQAALEETGAVYVHYTGGAGALAAKRIVAVSDVHWLEELGMPEAAWIFAVERFGPLLVTMDSAGGNLYRELEPTIARNRDAIFARIDEAHGG
ncbi:MAG: fumarate hydratase C-terminal domain-containing protein [Candidatus Bipolaricaulota bacterium]|nr:MAG: fumarate hydratase C-terminal domain-containing protein [Candidatus Bipolaricaulota bacterium]